LSNGACNSYKDGVLKKYIKNSYCLKLQKKSKLKNELFNNKMLLTSLT